MTTNDETDITLDRREGSDGSVALSLIRQVCKKERTRKWETLFQRWQQQVFPNTLFEKIFHQVTPSIPSHTMPNKP
jgi:hypothetical protein